MNRSTIILLSILGGFVLILLWGVGAYNRLVGLSERTESQWANVQSAYQRRADLIPNLVSTVKGYADFEQSTLTAKRLKALKGLTPYEYIIKIWQKKPEKFIISNPIEL